MNQLVRVSQGEPDARMKLAKRHGALPANRPQGNVGIEHSQGRDCVIRRAGRSDIPDDRRPVTQLG